jgi:hypothetical protein
VYWLPRCNCLFFSFSKIYRWLLPDTRQRSKSIEFRKRTLSVSVAGATFYLKINNSVLRKVKWHSTFTIMTISWTKHAKSHKSLPINAIRYLSLFQNFYSLDILYLLTKLYYANLSFNIIVLYELSHYNE